MPYSQVPYDLEALPLVRRAWEALLPGRLDELGGALAALAERVAARDPEDAAALRADLPPPGLRADAVEAWAEELVGEPLAAVVLDRAQSPRQARAALLLSGWLRFEDSDGGGMTAALLRGDPLPGLSEEESALYGLVALLDACELGEPTPCGPPPADAPTLGAALGLPGRDWEAVDPFGGRLVGGALVLAEED